MKVLDAPTQCSSQCQHVDEDVKLNQTEPQPKPGPGLNKGMYGEEQSSPLVSFF